MSDVRELIITVSGNQNRKVVYVITSLGWDKLTSEQLAALVRGHWTIENKIHYLGDVTFGEDASQIRTGHAPMVWPPYAT